MGKAYTPNIKSDKGKNLTKYVAEFVKKNKLVGQVRVTRVFILRIAEVEVIYKIFESNFYVSDVNNIICLCIKTRVVWLLYA